MSFTVCFVKDFSLWETVSLNDSSGTTAHEGAVRSCDGHSPCTVHGLDIRLFLER